VLSILTAGLLEAVVRFPALSLTEAVEVRPVPSPDIVLLAGQPPVGMPESASPQVQATITLPLYQPAPLGLVVGAPLRVGAVWSILMFPTVAVAELPALSTAVPVADW